MHDFKKLLIDNGIKPTFQRVKILEYIYNHKKHQTAEMIYAGLVDNISTLSKTTVYNTLQHLGDHGLVHALTISGSESRFDSVINPHHHFLCKTCGDIIDIDIECPNARKVESAGGHRIDEVHGYFKGVCASCLKKLKKGDD